MSQTNLTDKIKKVLDANQVCSLATIEGTKPHVRYMALFHDGINILLVTSKKTHKVEELIENPHVHIITGFNGDWESETLQVEGTASVSSDGGLRKKLWKDTFKIWFEGPEDPNYVVLVIKPQRILYSDGKSMKSEIWES
ncbi:general stress protein [Paenibacillus psychroresistens]|uniref:General stress protein n=1 Tax=Paenibacillus psychroresistens TaxID=1778678 RepID=A0A6B8RWY0_9BACL|nr:general stress protein [Paenibacillus psychroresistens]